MLTELALDIPSPDQKSPAIAEWAKKKWGEAFCLGWSRGRLDGGQLTKNPTGQVFRFPKVLVPGDKLMEFKELLVQCNGTILSEKSGDESVRSTILDYAAEFDEGVERIKLTENTLRTTELNLTSSDRGYVADLIDGLIKTGRLVASSGDFLTVNPGEPSWSNNTKIRDRNRLLRNIRSRREEIANLLAKTEKSWLVSDPLYRFYHGSFKTYAIQDLTEKIVALLRALDPRPGNETLNEMFETILHEGTGKDFDLAHNKEWMKHTRPQLEAFFHAKMFLEHALECGDKLDEAPYTLTPQWGHVLYLYCLR